jgi:hypothetical protein
MMSRLEQEGRAHTGRQQLPPARATRERMKLGRSPRGGENRR